MNLMKNMFPRSKMFTCKGKLEYTSLAFVGDSVNDAVRCSFCGVETFQLHNQEEAEYCNLQYEYETMLTNVNAALKHQKKTLKFYLAQPYSKEQICDCKCNIEMCESRLFELFNAKL